MWHTAAQVLLQFEEDFRYTSAPQLQAAAAPEIYDMMSEKTGAVLIMQ